MRAWRHKAVVSGVCFIAMTGTDWFVTKNESPVMQR